MLLERLDRQDDRLNLHDSRLNLHDSRLSLVELEAVRTTPELRVIATEWQDRLPIDPEVEFGDVDQYAYQTTLAWIQVLTPEGHRYGMAIVAMGDRDHDGRYREGSSGRSRGYHLFHDRRFGKGEYWAFGFGNVTSFLIRDGKLRARDLSNEVVPPDQDPFTVEVEGVKFGSTIDTGDPDDDYAVGVPQYVRDLPREPNTTPASVLVRIRSGAGAVAAWPPPEVAAIQIDEQGRMFLSVGGAFKADLGNPGDDFLIDLEGGRVVTHGSRVEWDFTDAIRWDVRGPVPGWPSS